MRLSNRTRAGTYHLIATLLLAFLVGGCILFLLEVFRFKILNQWAIVLIVLPLVLLVLFYLRGRQIFEYDSDGEALNFKNRNVFPIGKALNDEFPKYKMLHFEIFDAVVLRRLYVTLSSKKNRPVILKYDISYLRKNELRDLKVSLNKVIKTNQENRETRS